MLSEESAVTDISITLQVQVGKQNSLELPLSFEVLPSLVSRIPDNPENAVYFEAFAHHNSSDVRESIANKDYLNEQTIRLLCRDRSVEVIRNLVRSLAYRKYATEDDILWAVEKDIHSAITIAQDFEMYEKIDVQTVVEKLIHVADPAISLAIAGNMSTPKKITKQLLKHSDPMVQYQAKMTLDV